MTDELQHVGRTVRCSTTIAAAVERVYDAWAQPDGIARWFVDSAEGVATAGATVTWRFDAFGAEFPLDVVVADAPERIVYRAQPPVGPTSWQEVLFERAGRETRVTVIQSGFGDGEEWAERAHGCESGWTLALATLKHVLELNTSAERTHIFTMRPGRFDLDALRPLFRSADGLCAWLVEEALIEDATELVDGVRFRFGLKGGGSFEGSVVADGGRELLLEWPERNALLALKAFAVGAPTDDTTAVALDLNAWPLADSERLKLEARLHAALDALVGLVPSS